MSSLRLQDMMQSIVICSLEVKTGVSGWIAIWGSSQELRVLLYSLQVQERTT